MSAGGAAQGCDAPRAPCQARAEDTDVNFGGGKADGGQLSLAPTPTPAPPPLPRRCMAPPASPPSSSATSSVLTQRHCHAGLAGTSRQSRTLFYRPRLRPSREVTPDC